MSQSAITMETLVKPDRLDAVFLQPSWFCAKACPGCYVRAAHSDRGQATAGMWQQAIEIVLQKLCLRQITLAVDALPQSRVHASVMTTALSRFLSLGSYHSLQETELHITVNSVQDLEQYKEELPPDWVHSHYRWEKLDWVSVSNLTPATARRLRRGTSARTKINWNVLAQSFLAIDPATREKILDLVDHCYLLLNKCPTGQHNTVASYSCFFEALRVAERLPTELRHKVEPDHCMRDSARFNKEGFGCGANIRRLHIWPDLRVTGCPYNTAVYGKGILTEDIEEARNRYEFRDTPCRIPEDLRSSRRPYLPVVQ